MNEEIINLRAELEGLELELDSVRKEYKEKEENNAQIITKHKNKWEVKHNNLIKEIRLIQETYEKEKKKWQDQMLIQSETLLDLKQKTAREEENERKFLMQIDAELLSVAGRARTRSRENSMSFEGDTLFDSINEGIPEDTNSILHAVFKSREIIRGLLEKSSHSNISIPPLPQIHTPTFEIPDISKSLTDSYRDSSLYSKVLINDEILNSLSMSEREAVVYSLINSGNGPEEKREVLLEDLLNVTGAVEEKLVLSSGRFEDLSSIIEEESGLDSAKEHMGLTFSLPDVKVNELDSSRIKNIPPNEFSSINSNTDRSKLSGNLYSDIEVEINDTHELDKALVERASKDDISEESLNELKRDCKEFLKDR